MSKYFTDKLIKDYDNKPDSFFSDNHIKFYSNRYQQWIRINGLYKFGNESYVVKTDKGNLVVDEYLGVE